MEQPKPVFISHSSQDFEYADIICRELEAQQIYCWIAPRDIPYGDVWAEKLSSAICEAKVMLFLFTEHSNVSPQVIREINLALSNGLRIITLRMDDIPMSGALNYYLSVSQSIAVSADTLNEDISRLARQLKADLSSEEDESPDDLLPFIDINIDEEIEAQFTHTFYNDIFSPKTESPAEQFQKKLLDRIASNAIHVPPRSANESSNTSDLTEEESDENSLKDSFFRLSYPEGNIAVYVIKRQISEPDYQVTYYAQRLRSETETKEDGSKKSTYFCDCLDPLGNPLVFLHFLHERKIFIRTMGFMEPGLVSISNEHEPLQVKELFNNSATSEPARYRLNENSIYIVIDPDSGEEVPRKKYFDRKQMKWVHYMIISPYKKYFVFHVSCEEDGCNRHKPSYASDYFIGEGYYLGLYGLKKNNLEATYWLDKAGTGKSYYYLGRIFTEDPLLADKDDARYYFTKALEMGEKRAEKYLCPGGGTD